MPPLRIATLGDVMLDVIVRLEEPLARGGDVRAATRVGAGGQAANVAAWAASLGAEARCIAKRGDDDAGALVARALLAREVELVGPVVSGATGIVVSVVDDGERSMASDRGVAPSLEPRELEPAWLECDVLHVSGYALLREPIGAAALRAVELARLVGARISVDLAAWTEIRRFGPVSFRALLDELAPDVLFATEAEWELLGLGLAASPAEPAPPGRKTGRRRCPRAYLTAPVGVIKRGPRGCTVVTPDARLDLAPIPAEAVDPTGAGDALAAGFLLGLEAPAARPAAASEDSGRLGRPVGGLLEEAGRCGLEAAARCVARVGSLP